MTRSNGDVADRTGRPTDNGQLGFVDPACRVIGLHLYDGMLKVRVCMCVRMCAGVRGCVGKGDVGAAGVARAVWCRVRQHPRGQGPRSAGM